MATHGKKYRESAKLVDSTKMYSISEAVALLKKSGYTKFDGSVEIAVKTNADAKYNAVATVKVTKTAEKPSMEKLKAKAAAKNDTELA